MEEVRRCWTRQQSGIQEVAVHHLTESHSEYVDHDNEAHKEPLLISNIAVFVRGAIGEHRVDRQRLE